MEYVGIDVGTRACYASVLDEAGGIRMCLEFANEESGWRTLTRELDREAPVVVRYHNPMRSYYRRLVRRKERLSVALTAVARNVLVMVYAMLTRGERCRWEDRALTDVKVRNIRRVRERKVFGDETAKSVLERRLRSR